MRLPAVCVVAIAVLDMVAPAARAAAIDAGDREGTVGIATSATFPIARIYMLEGSYAPWRYGEVLGGFAFQNWSQDQYADAPGQAEAYTLLAGYRQFVWSGLHVEAMLWPAYNRFRSYLDQRLYGGFELWAELYVGYKFRIELDGAKVFLAPQPGILFCIAEQHEWPGFRSVPISRPIFVPQFLIGVEL